MIDRNPERFRRVILEEEFFPTSSVTSDTKAFAAPPEARALVAKWKGERERGILARRHAEESFRDIVNVHEEVNMGLAVQDGMRGYSVRRELVYPEE